jgi:hypothetical protein
MPSLNYEYKKTFALIGALIAGGLGIAVITSAQTVEAALSVN